MSEKLTKIAGKQNDFATRFMGGGSINAGTPVGVILTLNPPSGQRVRLTHLSTIGTSDTTQGSITIKFGDIEVVTSKLISGSRPTGSGLFSVGSFQDYQSSPAPYGNPPSGNYEHWTGAADEIFTITLGSVSPTGTIIYYGYEYGE